MRQVIVLSLVMAGAVAGACGDSDENGNHGGEQGDGDRGTGDGDRDNGDGDDGNSGDGDDSNSGDGDDSNSGDGDSSSPGMCEPSAEDMDFEGCTEAEIKAYSSCVQSACADKYVECYGPGYKQGNYSGVCGDYMECTVECGCDDTACFTACTPSSACSTCLMGFTSCSFSCISDLECAGIGGSGKTCADLLACCNSLDDADLKAECTTTHSTLSGIGTFGDLACDNAIPEYCP